MIRYSRWAITPNNINQQLLHERAGKAGVAQRSHAGQADPRAALVEKVKFHTGIVPRHLLALQDVAREYNCIIGIRPVDAIAAQLIDEGYPTKGFLIKGKSANWGLRLV